jgi:hypothetical protein
VPQLDEIVAIGDLPVIFDRVDAQVRAVLPPVFLIRFDQWEAGGGETTSRYSAPRAPGRTITASDLDATIEAFWGTDAARTADPPRRRPSRPTRPWDFEPDIDEAHD